MEIHAPFRAKLETNSIVTGLPFALALICVAHEFRPKIAIEIRDCMRLARRIETLALRVVQNTCSHV